jgi:hypothetical protein
MKRFNPPPGWPSPPVGWEPPAGWTPDPAWPEPPSGWELWLEVDTEPDRQTDLRDESHRTTGPPQPVETPLPPPLGETSSSADVIHQERSHSRLQDVLEEVGIYRYRHPLEDAVAYQGRLSELERQIDQLVKSDQAVLAADTFSYDGSLAKGRKMVKDFCKLMLRAYNAEAENCVRSVRSGNSGVARRRLESAASSIEKLGVMMEMKINPEYHRLRVLEIELTADYQMKVQEEKELAREERELLREQRRVEQELAAQREKLEKEQAHYRSALAALGESPDAASEAELRRRLEEIDEAIQANDFRAANVRAGYVYVISNVGAFGPDVVKIGMTRRLEPRERIHELGDASVPFPFDVHALFFSEDAVALEAELHRELEHRKVNRVNDRREFFFVTPGEVKVLLGTKVGGLLEFTEEPAAPEYWQSRPSWSQSG